VFHLISIGSIICGNKKRKAINGTVSAQDFNQIFNDIVAKEMKSPGYFDDKY
jgi:hypothetical protein